MLIQLGEAFIETDCIAAIAPKGVDGSTYAVWLTTGQILITDAVREEVETAVESMGYFIRKPELESDSDTGPDLNLSEIMELRKLHDTGYRYIARDKDGHAHAFASDPILQGAYWYGTDDCLDPFRLRGEYPFLTWEEKLPHSIIDLIT